MRGRKPDPDAKKALRGSRHVAKKKAKRKQPKRKLSRPVTPPPSEPPAWLGPIASQTWREIHRLLSAHGVFDHTDAYLLARYCSMVERFRLALAVIMKHGETETITLPGGREREILRPQSKIVTQLLPQLGAMEQQMGLTPYSRPRIPKSVAAPPAASTDKTSKSAEPKSALRLFIGEG